MTAVNRARGNRRVATLVAVVLGLTLTLTLASRADALVYWSNSGYIGWVGRANLDGTGATPLFYTGAPSGLAVDEATLYWGWVLAPISGCNPFEEKCPSPEFWIGRSDSDGSSVDYDFLATGSVSHGIAVDGTHIYWTNEYVGSVLRGDLGAEGVSNVISLITGAGRPRGVALDAAHVYWTNSSTNTIGRADLDGANADQSFITGAAGPHGVAVDGAHLYWTNSSTNTIGRADLDGANADQSFITGAHSPTGMAVDGAHLYWANYNSGSIGRADLDGANADQSFITGAYFPWDVAVDELPYPLDAIDDEATVDEGSGPTQIDVLANDEGVSGGLGWVASVTQPAHGTVAIAGDQLSLSYQPDAGFCNNSNPTDDFTYSLNGGSTATVAVSVTCTHDPPVAVDDSAGVAEDDGSTQLDILANDTDVGDGLLQVAAVTQPDHGTVTIAGDQLSVSYQPDPNYCNDGNATDDFTYTVYGGSTATVAVSVSCVDDPPVAVDDSAGVAEDAGPTQIDVLANDTDVDSGPMQVTAVGIPDHGTVTVAADQLSLSYQPHPDYCNDGGATDDFSYELNGGSFGMVSVGVSCVDDPPVAVDDTLSVAEDSAATEIDVLANDTDIDGGPKQVTAVGIPDHGTVTVAADLHSLSYQPYPDYCNDGGATDDFSYELNGGSFGMVSVGVSCVDDPPAAVDDSTGVSEDIGPTQIDVLANDTDVDGGPKQVTGVSQPAHGAVMIAGDQLSLSYEPDTDYCDDGNSTDDFTYSLNGGSTATVAVSVSCVDDPPVAVDDSAGVAEDPGATQIDVLANDTDPDGGPKQVTAVSQPVHGTVAVAGDQLSLSYQPDPNYCNDGSPTDDFTYSVAPGGSQATVAVSVSCIDDHPVAVDDTATMAQGAGATTIDVLINDTDVDGGPKRLASVSQPQHGEARLSGPDADQLSLSYQPDPNYCNDGSPTDDFTYTLNGGSQAGVAVTVNCLPSATDSPSPQVSPSPSPHGRTSIAFTFGAKRMQSVRRLEVTLGCGQAACEAKLGGRAVVRRRGNGVRASALRTAKRVFSIKPRAFSLAAGEERTVQVRFRRHRHSVKALRRLLRRRAYRNGAKAMIKVTAISASGDTATRWVSVKLRR